MGFKRLSLAERKLIEEYLKQDLSFYRIAELLNRSEHCLYNEVIARNGGRDSYNALEADAKSYGLIAKIGIDGLPTKKRSSHLTLKEREFIEQCLKDDISMNKLSFSMGRSLSTVAAEVRRNGGRSNYTAEKGHKRYLDNVDTKSSVVSKAMKSKFNKMETSENEITSLKMQVDILFDMIKEMRGGKK